MCQIFFRFKPGLLGRRVQAVQCAHNVLAAVDDKMRVRGVGGLRVVNALAIRAMKIPHLIKCSQGCLLDLFQQAFINADYV